MGSVQLNTRTSGVGSPFVWGVVLFTIGVLFTIVHIKHLLVEEAGVAALIGIYVPLVFSIAWVIPLGAVQILSATSLIELDKSETIHILSWISLWTVFGILWMMISSVGAILYETSEGVTLSHTTYLLVIFGTYGVIPGSITGYFYGRWRERIQRVEEQRTMLHVLGRVRRHNIRNKSNIVSGNIDLIRENSDDEEIVEKASAALTAMEKITDAIENERVATTALLDRETKQMHVIDTLRNAIEWVENTYPGTNVRLNINTNDTGITVRSHPKIERAFKELLENSVVHVEADEPTITVDVSVTASNVVIEVFDEGNGIPEDELVGLLNEATDDELRHGSGIGLRIVDVIVRTVDGSSLSFNPTDSDAVARITLPRK